MAIPHSAGPIGFAMRVLAPFEYYSRFRSRAEETLSRNGKNDRDDGTDPARRKQGSLECILEMGDQEKQNDHQTSRPQGNRDST